MSASEHKNSKPNLPFIDESLIINSRLSEVERKQEEAAQDRKKHERSQRRTNWAMVFFTGLLLLTSCFSDWFLWRQTSIARDSADAAKSAADTAAQTLSEVVRGGNDTHTLAIAAKDQAAAAKSTSETALKQAGAMKMLAGAAGKQAKALDIANEQTKTALHISQRAYLAADPAPQFDATGAVISVSISNVGRIPSGWLETVTHESTMDFDKPTLYPDLQASSERHWKRFRISSISPGANYLLKIPLPKFSANRIADGLQAVVISGRVSYFDGFQDDGEQTSLFCFSSTYHHVVKQIYWGPCEAPTLIPKMEALDGYPSGEQKP